MRKRTLFALARKGRQEPLAIRQWSPQVQRVLSIFRRSTLAVWAGPAALTVVWVVVAALTLADLTTVRPSLTSIDAARSASVRSVEIQRSATSPAIAAALRSLPRAPAHDSREDGRPRRR